MTEHQFRTYFVLGPLLFSSIVPSLIFGMAFNQWGSNVVWGSVFGLGWCLAAFASGTVVHDTLSTTIGLVETKFRVGRRTPKIETSRRR